ncbi:MAG TPA: PQQ-binding-like beta-propeller repeat protein [Thermoplasmata archaeon]|nr:PQQ-binding-like beta-propeller repeat protein [Thermoplasmata archaeon]
MVLAVLTAVPAGAATSTVHGPAATAAQLSHVAIPSGLGAALASASGARASGVPAPSAASTSGWSSVQVAFLVETTAYDGVYDPTAADYGADACAAASSNAVLCEESNGVPFFAAQAGKIATAIAAAHPGSNITFGLADFFASIDTFDDGDGYLFHADVQNFTNASSFGSSVTNSFQKNVLSGGYYYPDSDMSDNILHSSSITALYGVLGTAGLNWARSAHHVVVLIGGTAPRAPGYAEDYAVSPSDYAGYCSSSGCFSPTCEPAYNFSSGVASPACEGWTSSQTTNANDSIAWLAQHGQCAASLGGNCTVDTITLYSGITDPNSKAWPAGRTGGGPGGSIVKNDSARIVSAACALAAATGGSWDGPTFDTCPNGVTGTLGYVAHGSYNSPNTTNPTLMSALTNISVGAPAHHPGFNHAGDLLITDQFNNRVIEVNPLTRQIVWSFGSGNPNYCNPGAGTIIAPNSAERIGGGFTLISGTGTTTCPDNRVIVVNAEDEIVWQYGVAGKAGNATGYLNTPVDAIQLLNHDILIVDQGNNRVIEVNLDHQIVWSYGPTTGTGALSSPNSAERVANGDVLIADEGNNRVIEVSQAGKIVWSVTGLHGPASASRLANGNTLIADSLANRVIALNSAGRAVFSMTTNHSQGSLGQSAPTDAVQLPGGNFLVADQFNDRVIVINLHHQVVYQYGKTGVSGNGFDRLNDPYSAMEVGVYLGTTPPPPSFD